MQARQCRWVSGMMVVAALALSPLAASASEDDEPVPDPDGLCGDEEGGRGACEGVSDAGVASDAEADSDAEASGGESTDSGAVDPRGTDSGEASDAGSGGGGGGGGSEVDVHNPGDDFDGWESGYHSGALVAGGGCAVAAPGAGHDWALLQVAALLGFAAVCRQGMRSRRPPARGNFDIVVTLRIRAKTT